MDSWQNERSVILSRLDSKDHFPMLSIPRFVSGRYLALMQPICYNSLLQVFSYDSFCRWDDLFVDNASLIRRLLQVDARLKLCILCS